MAGRFCFRRAAASWLIARSRLGFALRIIGADETESRDAEGCARHFAAAKAAEEAGDRIGAIAAYATWSDVGLAAGAFIGIMGMELLGYPMTYAALGAMTLAAVAWFTLVRATRPQAPA